MISGLFSRLKQDASGAKILSAWLGNGGEPVDSSLANTRALTCKTCPHNVESKPLEKFVGQQIKDAKRRVEAYQQSIDKDYYATKQLIG
jgi:hypothetical protein